MPEQEKPAKPAETAAPAAEAKGEKKEEKKKEKKVVKKGKKSRKNKPTSQKWKFYKIEGDKIIREKSCPRCGPGIFLAKSKSRDRIYCGRCHWTEFAGKEAKAEEKPAEKTEETEKKEQ